MSADNQQSDARTRDSIDALTQRVDTLAAIVRETAGGLAANRGEVASLERRQQERFRQETEMAGAALASVRSDLDALRRVGSAAGRGPAATPSPLLDEPIAALGMRIDTLAEIVGSTAGRLQSEESRTRALAEALAQGDERVEARLTEIQRNLEVVSRQAAAALAAPATVADSNLEQRVAEHLGAVDTRLDFVMGTASDTAARLSATHGDLARLEKRREEQLEALEVQHGQSVARTDEALRSMRGDLDALKSRQAIDPMVHERVEGLVDSMQALGDRVGTLSGIVSETAGRIWGRDDEMTALGERLGAVEVHVDDVAGELRKAIDVLTAAAAADSSSPVADRSVLDADAEAFGEQLGRIEAVVAGVSAAAEEMGADLRAEIAVLTDAVARERADLIEAGREWEAGRSALEGRLDDVAALAAATAERGADELGRALHALGERLERLEDDRQSAASGATDAESAWAREKATLEARLDAIAGAMTANVPQTPELAQLVDELGDRIARVEGEREAAADLAALVETWTDELAMLETRVEAGLSTLQEQGVRGSGGHAELDTGLLENLDDLTERIARIERDRDAVRSELSRTEQAWAEERGSLQERFAELAAFASSAVERGTDEMGRALHTLAERLERLEQDRQAVATDASETERAWAEERNAIEARLDAIATAAMAERPLPAGVARVVDELAQRLARMERERETLLDLAAVSETWTAELSALEARVDEGLSTLEEQASAGIGEQPVALDSGMSTRLDEMTQQIARIERDRDAVRAELTQTATSWAAERASLQERVSELAARIVTGPVPAATEAPGNPNFQSPQELDSLRIGVEGLRMRLAYHEKTVSELAGSRGRGVVERLDELSARVDQLAAAVAASLGAQAQPSHTPSAPQVPAETGSLIARLDEAERRRRESREKMLEQMDRIASQMDWRMQRLETGVETRAGSN